MRERKREKTKREIVKYTVSNVLVYYFLFLVSSLLHSDEPIKRNIIIIIFTKNTCGPDKHITVVYTHKFQYTVKKNWFKLITVSNFKIKNTCMYCTCNSCTVHVHDVHVYFNIP